MKQTAGIISFLILIVSSVSYATPITDPDNPHNMSSLSSAGSVRAQPPSSGGTDQICVFCHTPHSAAPESPLWSRPDPTGPNGNGTFPVYAVPLQINQNAAAIALTGYDTNNPNYPNGASRMCLSCHDGVTSIGVLLGGAPIIMESGSETVTNNTIQGIIDLSTSHPISFNYNDNVINTLLDTMDYQMPSAVVDTPLSNGQMQCTTCHDPHEDTRGLAAYDFQPFWRHQGNAMSYDDVCNNCHKTGPVSTSPPHSLP
jgi:cytochrome c553